MRSGAKTASCGAARDFDGPGDGSEAMPRPGRRDVALDWDGVPALLIETLSVELIRFCDVPEDFVLAEGENDSLEGWRTDHRAFFARNGGYDPQMMLVCERFRLVADLAATDRR